MMALLALGYAFCSQAFPNDDDEPNPSRLGIDALTRRESIGTYESEEGNGDPLGQGWLESSRQKAQPTHTA